MNTVENTLIFPVILMLILLTLVISVCFVQNIFHEIDKHTAVSISAQSANHENALFKTGFLSVENIKSRSLYSSLFKNNTENAKNTLCTYWQNTYKQKTMFKTTDFQSGYDNFNVEINNGFLESYVSLESIPPFNILNKKDTGKTAIAYIYNPIELIRNTDLIKDIIEDIKSSDNNFIKNSVEKFWKGNKE